MMLYNEQRAFDILRDDNPYIEDIVEVLIFKSKYLNEMGEDQIYVWVIEVGGLLHYLNKFMRGEIVSELMIDEMFN